MASQIKVDTITDSSGILPVDCPNGVTTTELVADEMISDTWKNTDGTENYKCRAWVNFDGTTTPPAIRASGNVSSVVRNSAGVYTVNLITALPDNNMSFATMTSNKYSSTASFRNQINDHTVSSVVVSSMTSGGTPDNASEISLVIFR